MDDEQVFHEPEQRPNQSEEHKTCVGVHLLGVVSFFLFFFVFIFSIFHSLIPPTYHHRHHLSGTDSVGRLLHFSAN